jgi:hypothetical protein
MQVLYFGYTENVKLVFFFIHIHLLGKTSYFILVCYLAVFLTQYCAGDKIEKNEMGWACGTYGGRERCAQGFGGETRGKEIIGKTKA